ncbi:MAG TPA: TerB family tellurite resistance protein [Methyloceanibacter sp.]|nr:TerB family tellurite resistance protein [Methyloceanibacter sp.]
MSIWDNLAAATADFRIMGVLNRDQKQDRHLDEALPFTVGMISLAAKMAKADGVVTKDEVHAFKKAFKVSDAEMKHAARAFNLAKQDVSGYETCAEGLVAVLRGDRKMLEYILEGVFHIATADGVLHSQEEAFLRQVAKHFGLTDAEFTSMKARHTIATERNPYDVLGMKPSVSNDELRSQYRKLVAESQPDEFVTRGLPKEFVLIATEKVAAIKQAYDAIAKERGI